MTFVNNTWPSQMEENLKPFYTRKNELNTDQCILMWGYRVVLPEKIKSTMLNQIHENHFEITKLKQLARSYFWYSNMDQDLERLVKSCEICMLFRAEPEKASLIKWPQTEKPFERIHLDFAGLFKGHMFLVSIDSYTKWSEVFIMKNTDALSTIEALREIFARFGLPSQIVTDNGEQFTSKEFSAFCVKNRIKHSTSSAFHPSTNGAAENFVKTLKTALAKAMKDPKNRSTSLRSLLNRFLFAYRTTPYCVTGETPDKLMFNRNVRTLMDLIKPAFKKKQIGDQQEHYRGTRDIIFKEGDPVMARDYRIINKKTWAPAVVTEVLGSRT
ncbi:hypothetical protein RF55_12828 [Lasius niger]|uniref:RNA-directed DNA polymerase n=1 Tax=Lasius niger TaxID=67767 RepID=A0A0J7KC29_LASNI|nr:hypothetical protein RF55_12828 [Lasius niger]